MRVACPTCEASYKVGDDKVAGRTVKIRCKRCNTIIVIEGRPASTGQRNEDSVLFTLSMLSAPAPASPSSEPSGLIDLQALMRAQTPARKEAPSVDGIMNLDVGGIYTPLLTSPHAEPPPAKPVRWGWVVALGAAVPIAVVAAAFGFTHAHAQPVVAATQAPPSIVASPPPPVTAPPVVVAAAATVTSAASVTPHRRAAPVPTTTATATAKAPVCCAGETEMECAMRRSVGASCGH